MNLEFYFEKLYASEEFKEFKKENKKSFFCGGFFVIDYESKHEGDKTHLDFFVPENKKIFSFQLEDNCEKIPVEQVPENITKIPDNLEIDFKEIEKIIRNKMQEEKIKNQIQKLLFSLQNIDGKNFLIGTIFISGLGMIKVNINLDKKEVTDFQKKSFMDMFNIFKKS